MFVIRWCFWINELQALTQLAYFSNTCASYRPQINTHTTRSFNSLKRNWQNRRISRTRVHTSKTYFFNIGMQNCMLKHNRRISRTSMQKKVPTELSYPQPSLFFEEYNISLRLQAVCCILRISRTRVHNLAFSRGFIAGTCVFHVILKQFQTTAFQIHHFNRQNE